MLRHLPLVVLVLAAVLPAPLAADGIALIQRVLPPEGIEIPAEVRERLETKLAETQKRLDAGDPMSFGYWDVEVFLKAVRLALLHREFYSPKDFEKADWALAEANKRLDSLERGEMPWTTATGPVVHGYRSSIDGSVQPYGVVVPEGFKRFARRVPIYVWLHGRGDKNTDLHFIYERATKIGQIAPPGAIVLHPFGRHCVGWKHAGEVDVLDVALYGGLRYGATSRPVLIGFSMGGAGAWHIGAHYTDRWAAVCPGAGFAETARYQRLTPDKYPPKYEQTLWGLYDVPGYVRNLFNTRVIAYSGELDKQIQAARVMEEAYKAEGRELTHLIGPGVEHKYEPNTLKDLLRLVDDRLTEQQPPFPTDVSLQTRTLRYNAHDWVRIQELKEHWQDSRVDAEIIEGKTVRVRTKNVVRLELAPVLLESEPGTPQIQRVVKDLRGRTFEIDGQSLEIRSDRAAPQVIDPLTAASRSIAYLVRKSDKWLEDEGREHVFRKRPGLQGPIDDAFLERFVVIEPTGKSRHPEFQAWCEFELAHFKSRWRALMRGELPVKRDVDVSRDELDLLGNVVLFGDADSNAVIRLLADDLPVKHREGTWSLGGTEYGGGRFVPALVFPRKSSRGDYHRYVVLNSGLTFREGHDRTNSLQNPKLPDWAIIDISQPPDAFAPGRIHDAGFFDEAWQLKGSVKGPTP